MCCSGADWKREEVPDHKFDFIDVSEFYIPGCFTRLRYIWVYILVGKSFLVYASDMYTAIAMLASNTWSGSILQKAGDSKAVQVPFSIGRWIFTGCIIFSFLLLAWEARKARAIIRSRDISYSYTNIMANNYYSMKSYNHFCFFCQINNSKKKKDEFAFFVFFTFKGWKRLLLADAPRQVINGLTLYSFGKAFNFTTDISVYYEGSILRAGILVTMIFTVVVWIGSAILLMIAALLYIPLLCYIQGNLKEYCCHKIDKRIAELMKRKTRKRLLREAALALKEAAGDFSHLKDKKGNLTAKPMAQPTLPNVGFDDDEVYAKSEYSLQSLGQYPPGNPPHWQKQQRYQLNDEPMSQGMYYASSEGGYEPSIASMGDRPLVAHAGPGGGQAAASSHSLVDYGGYPLSKAPSYRSEASNDYHRRLAWQNERAPSMPLNDPYASDAEDHGRAASPALPHAKAYAPAYDDAAREYLRRASGAARPESQWDLGQYYSSEPENDYNNGDDRGTHWR